MAVGVAKAKITFKLGTRKLTLDYRRVPFSAWSELKTATKFTQSTLINPGLAEADLDAVVAVIWLERKQRERKLRYHDVYRELEDDKDFEDFEVVGLVVDGRVVIRDDEDEPEDPTAGS